MITKYEQRDVSVHASRQHATVSYPARFHRDAELVYVVEGQVELTVDGKLYVLTAGDAAVVFPNITHATVRQDATKYLLMVDPLLLPSLTQTLTHKKPRCPVVKVTPVITALFGRCAGLSAQSAPKATDALICHTGSILSELLLTMELEERSTDSNLVQRLAEYIPEHYADSISLEQVAQGLGYSKFHISRVIRDTFGCNFRALVNNYRISTAEDLLRSSAMSISEIAYACGFQNQSSFNRVFLQSCGMTPKDYRKGGPV